MSKREPRFEIVHSHAGWFARFVAANGRKVWQTEIYQRQAKARNAIECVVKEFPGVWVDPFDGQVLTRLSSWNKTDRRVFEVREVDERTFPPLGDAL